MVDRAKIGYLLFFCFTLLSLESSGALRTASVSGNWNNTATWGGESVPTAADDVFINNGITVTVNGNAFCLTLTMNNGNAASRINISGTNSLSVTGAIIMNSPSNDNNSRIINVGSGILNCASLWMGNPGNGTNRTIQLLISTGTATIAGNLQSSGSVTENFVTFSGNGLLNIGGNYTGGALTASSGTVNYNGANQTLKNGTTIYNNLILSGSGNKTMGASTTIGGSFSVESGVTVNINSTINVQATGNTTIDGTLVINNISGSKTFSSDVTINNGGRWSETVNEPVTFGGNLTNNGSFVVTNTGNHTFSGANKIIGGTNPVTIPNIRITSTITNNTTLTSTTTLDGAGTLTQAQNSILNINGTSALTTLNASANQNIVNYTGAAQTVKATTYHHINLLGSGTKTFGVTTINGTMYVAPGVLAAINNTINVTSSGNVSIDGTLRIINTTGTKTFTGNVEINNGGAWTETVDEPIVFGANLINNGTFTTTRTGVHTFSGTGGIIGGVNAITIPYVTVSGTYTNTTNLAVTNTLSVGNSLTNEATINITTALSGTGSITQGVNSTLNINGTSAITTLNAIAFGNTVNYRGAAQTVKNANYYHLIISGTNTKTMPSAGISIAGNFTTSGTVTATANAGYLFGGDITLGSGTTFNAEVYSHTLAGNWSNNGATFNPSSGTFTFNGSNSQNIAGSANTTFNCFTVNNASGVVLGRAVNAACVTLTNGLLTTSLTNLLTVTGTTVGAITGSAASYVYGPLARNLPAVSSTNYTFPVGKLEYNPIEFLGINTSGAVTLRAEVYDADCGGTSGVGMSSLNSNRYWNATLTSGEANFTNTRIRLTESGMGTEDAIGQSSSQSGAYDRVSDDPPSGNTIISWVTPLTSLGYFVIGVKPIITIAATNDGTEGGANALFTISTSKNFTVARDLNFSISGTASNGTDYSKIISPISFPAGQSSITIPINIVDDASVEPTETVSIQLLNGVGYAVGNPSETTINIYDNDSPGITVSTISGNTTEAGGEATFTIVLTSQPTANVSISLSSSNTNEGIVLSPSVTFTPLNWNTAQPVTVRGVNDNIDDGDQSYWIITAPASSTDNNYKNLDANNVLVINTDDDTAGITVNPINGLTTSESGLSDQFSIVLNSEPTASVTINLWSNNTSEGIASPASVIFIPSEWNIPQLVTVTGANDFVVDGSQEYQIITDQAISTDFLYNIIDPSDVLVTTTDNDLAGFMVNPTSGLQTSEAPGGIATFTIRLSSQPIALVTLTFLSSNITEGTVSPTSVTFDNTDWNVNKTITLTGVDGPDNDGDQTYFITISSSTSDDVVYQSVADLVLTVINVDDDTPGFTVNPTTITTNESGTSASFSVVPNTRPHNDVTISVNAYDTSEGSLSTTTLIFTYDNWSTAQFITVTGVHDDVDDDDITYSIVFNTSSSTDDDYNNRTLPNITVTNTDDDVAGIVVGAISGNTSEAGGQATFTIVLTSEPLANVRIDLSTSDPTEGTVSPAYVEFIPSEWDLPVTVYVTGVDDLVQDGNITYTIQTSQAISTDLKYAAINPPNVTVVNIDNDVAGFEVTPTVGLVTSEAGGTASFQIRLTSQPTANVTVQFTSSDPTEGTVSLDPLTFTTSDWNSFKTIVVTGQEENEVDGTVIYSIAGSVVPSADLIYNSRVVPSVSVSNTDNDVAGITVSPTLGLTTTEATGAGNSTTFTVRLTSKPSSPVTLAFQSQNINEGTVSPASYVFNTTNWNANQTVTIYGVDDFVMDSNITYNIRIFVQSTSDPNYSPLSDILLPVTNIDNDVAGITILPFSDLITTEAGGAASIEVRLNSQPTDNVTIFFSSSNTNEGVLSASSVLFTPSTWNTEQLVNVIGVNDFYIDGDVAYSIITTVSSNDLIYHAINPTDVSVTNMDNDVATIIVDPTEGLVTSEDGTSDVFAIRLASIPTNSVTVNLSSSNTDEGTVSPLSVTIQPANWNVNHLVNVIGVDENVDDDDVIYWIETSPASSSDGNYNNINPDDVQVTNGNNDEAGITVLASGTLITSEDGTSATFTIVLDTRPTANVTIQFTHNTNEGTLSPSPVVFNTTNWNVPVTVTVTGKNDNDIDGDIEYAIISTATSSDLKYNGLTGDEVNVMNLDNDIPSVIISPYSGLNTTEAGGTATFTVVLGTKPKNSVTISLTSSNTYEGTVSEASLTFTSSGSNWTIPQTVTLTGINDQMNDGNKVYYIQFEVSSSDIDYNGLVVDNLEVTNLDLTPTISLGNNPTVCGGETSAALTYASTSKSPNQYYINFDAIAEAQGFTDVPFTALPTSPINITVPPGAAAKIYTGTLVVRNSSYAMCISPEYTFTITINRVTSGGTIADDQTLCNGGNPAAFTNMANGAGSGTISYRWEQSSIDCSSGFSPIDDATLSTYDPPAGITQTTYYRRVTISTQNGVACEANSNCLAVIVNSISVALSKEQGDEECPELDAAKGFNPDNDGPYNAGATKVVFRVTRQNSSAPTWAFDYEIQHAIVYATSPEDQTGTISGIATNYYDLHFYITNDPGNPIDVKLVVTEVSDSEGCIDTTNVEETINIFPMPAVGTFK